MAQIMDGFQAGVVRTEHADGEITIAYQIDEYLTQAINKKEYLVHKLFTEERTTETAVH